MNLLSHNEWVRARVRRMRCVCETCWQQYLSDGQLGADWSAPA